MSRQVFWAGWASQPFKWTARPLSGIAGAAAGAELVDQLPWPGNPTRLWELVELQEAGDRGGFGEAGLQRDDVVEVRLDHRTLRLQDLE